MNKLPFEEIWIRCRTQACPECNDPQFWVDIYERDFGPYSGAIENSRQKYLGRIDQVALASVLARRALTWTAFQELTFGLSLPQTQLRDIWQSERPSLEQLPADVLFDFALDRNIIEITNLCRTSKRLDDILCTNEQFWRIKFKRDYGELLARRNVVNWRELYFLHNTVSGFGISTGGQLANPYGHYHFPVKVFNKIAKQVSCGGYHTAIIDGRDNIWMFGRNEFGQLGLEDDDDKFIPMQIPNIKVRQVGCGTYHTVIIDLNYRVWSFGHNRNGQLGLGHTQDRDRPTPIPHIQAQQVSCGYYHSMLIDMENNILVFGSNAFGQLGIGSPYVYSPSPKFPTYNDQKIKAQQMGCGQYHSVIIDINDNIMVAGDNRLGQIGFKYPFIPGGIRQVETFTPVPEIKAQQVSCGKLHTALIDLSNNILVCGENLSGQLGLGSSAEAQYTFTQVPLPKAQQVACGEKHTLVIDLQHNLWAFGNNTYGQLGLRGDKDKPVPAQVPLTKATQVSAGAAHTVFIGHSLQEEDD